MPNILEIEIFSSYMKIPNFWGIFLKPWETLRIIVKVVFKEFRKMK